MRESNRVGSCVLPADILLQFLHFLLAQQSQGFYFSFIQKVRNTCKYMWFIRWFLLFINNPCVFLVNLISIAGTSHKWKGLLILWIIIIPHYLWSELLTIICHIWIVLLKHLDFMFFWILYYKGNIFLPGKIFES